MKKNNSAKKSFIRALTFFLGFVFLVLILGIFWPYNFDQQDYEALLQTPSWQHWAGTDSLGRDLMARMLFGARISLIVGFSTTILSFLFGIFYGSTAGWCGGWVDSVLMRIVDLFVSIPTLALIVLAMVCAEAITMTGQSEFKVLFNVIFAIAVTNWTGIARLTRIQLMKQKQLPYIEAAHALGTSSLRTIFRHAFPNMLGPILVMFSFQVPANMVYESFLSFIGVGLQAPFASWGTLAHEAWRSLRSYPHLIFLPSLALFLSLFLLNWVAESLNDWLDPRS